MSAVLHLSMENNPPELVRLLQKANGFMESRSLPAAAVYKANLVLEEILTNILKYAFTDSDAHRVDVQLALRDRELTIQIMDDGLEFDPLAIPGPEMKNSILEATEGGLGVHLVRQTADAITYRRDASRNILTMTLGLQS